MLVQKQLQQQQQLLQLQQQQLQQQQQQAMHEQAMYEEEMRKVCGIVPTLPLVLLLRLVLMNSTTSSTDD